ncbi:MAG: HAMP domain-containing protein [Anaerolineae bacterium]|nr:HAMP domain-containing protein [Anaerolineae bacterium]
MKSILLFYRHIEWLHVFSYVIIIAAEMLILMTAGNSPYANTLRYVIFFGTILASLLLIRQRIIKPIQEMTQASLHIVAGNYHNRLPHYGTIEINELAQTFNQMTAHLENVEAQRVALIGSVAHELRTPLNNIRMTMEGLVDEVFTPDIETFLDIQQEVSRLQRLVVQLEQLSKAESGQVALTLQATEFGPFVRAICDRMDVQYESKGVELAFACDAGLPSILIDRDHMTQVAINLLGNALQYTPAGGKVTVQVVGDGAAIVTRIQDSGIGIPADELPRIFERFYRVDQSRSRSSGGNGIGLTIARQLVRAHGGTLQAESAGPGAGSTFTFTLPVRTVASQNQP